MAATTMAKQPKPKNRIDESQVADFKFTKQLAPLLERLHDVGTERDRAGNRQLHMDQYCLLIFTFLFNPVVTSLPTMSRCTAHTMPGSRYESARKHRFDLLLADVLLIQARSAGRVKPG
jgi:hypothetical protein